MEHLVVEQQFEGFRLSDGECFFRCQGFIICGLIHIVICDIAYNYVGAGLFHGGNHSLIHFRFHPVVAVDKADYISGCNV